MANEPQPRQPLYAYATRNEAGALVITHEFDRGSQLKRHYVIPVSADMATIERRGEQLTQDRGAVVDISPLVETGVIPAGNVRNLDIPFINMYPDLRSKKDDNGIYGDLFARGRKLEEEKSPKFFKNLEDLQRSKPYLDILELSRYLSNPKRVILDANRK